MKTQYEIVIVGSGPAGISLGVEAIKAGVKVEEILILEKENHPLASIKKFYPADKLVTANYKNQIAECIGELCIKDMTKDELVQYLENMVLKNKLEILTNTTVSKIEKLSNGKFEITTNQHTFQSTTCAIAIGIMGRPNRPSYPLPTDIRDKFHFDLNSPDLINKKVLVVGGGDSASEYAQILSRQNKVTLSYRQSEFHRMNDKNNLDLTKLIKDKTILFYANTNIERIDSINGKPHVIFNAPTPPETFDEVVFALGGTTPTEFLKAIGITATKDGIELTEFFETKVPGLFLVGDLSSGKRGGSINQAFNTSKKAVGEFCRSYIECQNLPR